MSNTDTYQQERASCPDCGMLNVVIQTAPRKPPRMHCTNCQWNSIDGSHNEPEIRTDGGQRASGTDQPRCSNCGAFTTEVMVEAGQSGRMMVKYCTKCDPNNRSVATESER